MAAEPAADEPARDDEPALAHGAESYFVVGEACSPRASVVGCSARSRVALPLPHRLSGSPASGPKGIAPSERARVKLGLAMTSGGGGASDVPAGFTYLGQFIDHDLTFDRTTVTLGTEVAPADLLQGRSPSLDLDSLYGAGPTDSKSARFYSDGEHLKIGKTVAIGGLKSRDGFDLPRASKQPGRARRQAVIPDLRNDENLAVAQTHLAMIRFHNRVVDRLPAAVPAEDRFRRASRSVVKHYQWMIRHDYLPRICRKAVLDDVFTNGRKIFEVGVDATQVPTMPLESRLPRSASGTP
jgi:hypothetical protein